jgi:hypothetical protein
MRQPLGGDSIAIGRGSEGGVAFDSEGNLVVDGVPNHCIQVLRYSDVALLRTIGQKCNGNSEVNAPRGIALDGAGHHRSLPSTQRRIMLHLCSSMRIYTAANRDGKLENKASNVYLTVIATIRSIVKCTMQRLIHTFTQIHCRQLHETFSNCEQL